MFRLLIPATAAVLLITSPAWSEPAYIAKAVADSSRPATDKEKDALRKPAEMLEFGRVKPGQKIADLVPGAGYFTRLFAKVVGPNGKVYAVTPAEFIKQMPDLKSKIEQVAAEPGYGNVAVLFQPANTLNVPESLDLVWTAQNYHDVYGYQGKETSAALDKAIFAALKPGGYYVVIDHSGRPGTGATEATTLHRIEMETVKAQVLEAGFVLDATSNVLSNPADKRDLKVFDPAIRGHTDQFALRFRKPTK